MGVHIIKKSIVLVLIFVLVILFSDVCAAADVINNDTGITYNGSNAVQNAIDSGMDGQTIILNSNIYFENNIRITSKNITLKGRNNQSLAIIDAEHKNQVFYISNGSNVTFENLIIKNGLRGIYNTGNLTLKNCIIQDNYIYSENGNNGLSGTNGTNGYYGSYDYPYAGVGGPGGNGTTGKAGSNGISGLSGGGIYNTGIIHLNNCTIQNNYAGSGGNGGAGGAGGAGCNGGDGIDYTGAGGNGGNGGNGGDGADGGNGGGIYNTGVTYLTNSTVKNNYAGPGGSSGAGGPGGKGGNGGSISYAYGTYSNGDGGKGGKGGNSGMSGKGGDGGDGGGIYSTGTIYLTDSKIINNTAGSQGGYRISGYGGSGGKGGVGRSGYNYNGQYGHIVYAQDGARGSSYEGYDYNYNDGGNPGSGDNIVGSTVIIDLNPPILSNIDPLNGLNNVWTNKNITITFNENIKTSLNFNNITLKTSSDEEVLINKSIIGRVLSIKHSDLMRNTTYILTIPPHSISDIAGNDYTNLITSNFTTTNLLPGCDLKMDILQIPFTNFLGSPFIINLTIKNTGLNNCGNFYTKLYISKDPLRLFNDSNFFANIYIPSLGSDKSFNQSKSYDLILPLGIYYIGYSIDYNNQVNESNEDNNKMVNSNTMEVILPPDTTPPTVNASLIGGKYNTTKTIILSISEAGLIYYTLDGTAPSNTSSIYNNPLVIPTTSTLKFFAVDEANNPSAVSTETYTIDKIVPTANANVKSGLYNTNKVVSLTMSETGNIYYTLNGATPTKYSTKYTKPLTIALSTTLKFIGIDEAGNPSPVYTATYKIDKTVPKVISTYPKRYATKVSRISTMYIKFSEKLKAGVNWSKIVVKNKYGKAVSIRKWISNNVLYIKTSSKRSRYSYYTIYIPAYAIKDYAGNYFAGRYTIKFKTGRL